MFLGNKQYQQKNHLSHVQNTLAALNKSQQQPEFQSLIQLLNNLYLIYNAQLQRDIHTPDKINQITFQTIKLQSQKILLKNQRLKEKVLIIRARLSELHRISHPLKQSHIETEKQTIEKIKLISTQIKTKIISLKEKQFLNKQDQKNADNYTARHSPKRYNQKLTPSSLLSIEEMKRGAELMAKSLIKTQYDMEATDKILRMEKSLGKNR